MPTINLKSAQFGSTLKLEGFVKTRQLEGLQTKQIRPVDATVYQLHMEYHGLTQAHIDGLIDFLILMAAKRILLSDEFGNIYNGFVVTPIVEIKQTHALPCPLYATAFDFEGQRTTAAEAEAC